MFPYLRKISRKYGRISKGAQEISLSTNLHKKGFYVRLGTLFYQTTYMHSVFLSGTGRFPFDIRVITLDPNKFAGKK